MSRLLLFTQCTQTNLLEFDSADFIDIFLSIKASRDIGVMALTDLLV